MVSVSRRSAASARNGRLLNGGVGPAGARVRGRRLVSGVRAARPPASCQNTPAFYGSAESGRAPRAVALQARVEAAACGSLAASKLEAEVKVVDGAESVARGPRPRRLPRRSARGAVERRLGEPPRVDDGRYDRGWAVAALRRRRWSSRLLGRRVRRLHEATCPPPRCPAQAGLSPVFDMVRRL